MDGEGPATIRLRELRERPRAAGRPHRGKTEPWSTGRGERFAPGCRSKYCQLVSFSQHRLAYPADLPYLKYLNRPCSSQRHFFPDTFAATDRIINLDTDIIMLESMQELWGHFEHFNATSVIGMSSMIYAEDKKFRHFPKPPHEGLDDGINTGISLFAMSAWRRLMPSYHADIEAWYKKYGKFFKFPTQDIFNVWLGVHPEQYYELPCEWNYRHTFQKMLSAKPPQKYKYQHICPALTQVGAKALHGAGGHFTDSSPGFSQVFRVFESFKLQDGYEALKRQLAQAFRQEGLSPAVTRRHIGRVLSRAPPPRPGMISGISSTDSSVSSWDQS